jgi:hypothetical protein
VVNELKHIGTLHKSGRYPWGSGETPEQRNISFLTAVAELKKKGLTDKQIYEGMKINSTEFRARKTIAKNGVKKAEIAQAERLKATGMSNVAIGIEMDNRNESSVRALLDPGTKIRNEQLMATANMVRERVHRTGFLDVGKGTENQIGIAESRLKNAVAVLKEEGYPVYQFKSPQPGNPTQMTTMLVLATPDKTFSDTIHSQDKIRNFSDYSEDQGKTWTSIETPINVSSKRIYVRYAEDGGSEADGLIELRRGVADISLGDNKYAQVRVSVDGTHFLKGMAMYSDHVPDGKDIVFNSSKKKSDVANDLEAMKPLKEDKDLPFASIIRQNHYIDSKGKERLSALNIVGPEGTLAGEEGAWEKWNKSLSSQMLSKQPTTLAKQQLAMTFDFKQQEFDLIKGLTNPTVRKKMLETFADSADSSSVHLKAAALPRQRTHVLLPIKSMKDNEIYAPNFNPGESVVLIRFPHGGKFEIPTLTVNNRNREAIRLMGQAQDAVGINATVARHLSGADFDGDTVLVIPNNSRTIKTEPAIPDLKEFDPQVAYPGYDGMPVMKSTQQEMGMISNLITDMTIKGAPNSEIARAVKHSMVVIDAEKKKLNYRLSAQVNGIKALKARYQESPNGGAGGASTLLSRRKSVKRVPLRRERRAFLGGPVDPATGEKRYEIIGGDYPTISKKTGLPTGKRTPRVTKSTKLAEATNAHTLSSGQPIEEIYADHSNKLKALANAARKAALETPKLVYDPSANKAYAPQVASLNGKLNTALKNKPLERQATLIANVKIRMKRQANPAMDAGELKKIRNQAMTEARHATGADKQEIPITPIEWQAIQSGAITDNKLQAILDNTNVDLIKELATPRTKLVMSSAILSRARGMLASGYPQSEVADALGISVTTLIRALNP